MLSTNTMMRSTKCLLSSNTVSNTATNHLISNLISNLSPKLRLGAGAMLTCTAAIAIAQQNDGQGGECDA
mgnify:CR=1 FL=1